MTRARRYIRYLVPFSLFGTHRTRQILTANPVAELKRKDVEKVAITAYDYNANNLNSAILDRIEDSFQFKGNNRTTWINVDGIRVADVEKLAAHFGIHALLAEDIVSMNQRPKMDDVDDVLFCLLNMLYFNEKSNCVEQEQISIALGKDFVITFQEDPQKDVFNPIRDKLRINNSKLRQRGPDYLCYSMLDLIVDNYFYVMEKLGDRIEQVEEEVIRKSNTHSLARINHFRKELIVLKRNIAPVRDLIGGIVRSESELLEERTLKYFKDVHDHIIQAHDLSENYRDVMISMQDLYINNVNLRMNEVMKVMAIVTCLLAPATVIGGIFGMNFDVIPTIHNEWGFFIAVGLMLLIPVWMLFMFKKRGWF
ncbi:magnesium/cobalt transporter CorA [Chitinophagaceae bacterium LB-8]|uniref:Magnesium transport protein CorA n=1 Tax=Paraflavisolibacter caeni TaxID=2982496 RepID=A0A9X2XPC9_9BACT|nr:magnesium/cobalt transporter CorA [Paraflavisolibacter caeni]MCU7550993.1 magnesium/cobalt transporter CorA [Paraflavisolibacter caeni]